MYNGQRYEVELCDEHSTELFGAMMKWADIATAVGKPNHFDGQRPAATATIDLVPAAPPAVPEDTEPDPDPAAAVAVKHGGARTSTTRQLFVRGWAAVPRECRRAAQDGLTHAEPHRRGRQPRNVPVRRLVLPQRALRAHVSRGELGCANDDADLHDMVHEPFAEPGRPSPRPSAGELTVPTLQNIRSGAPSVRPVTPVNGADPDGIWEMSTVVGSNWLAGFGASTKDAYRRDLGELFTFAGQMNTAPLALTRGQLDLYVRYLTGARGLAPKTVARRLSTASGYFQWAVDEAVLQRNPARRVRRPRLAETVPAVIYDVQDAKLLVDEADQHSLRAGVLVRLLILNALRISEIVGADASGYTLDRGHRVLSIRRKGGARENIVLAGSTAVALDAYLDGRREGPLLLSRTGRRLDRSNAARLLSTLGSQCLSPEKAAALHPHSCRHLALTAALDLGCPLRDVQDFAAHASADQTRAYDDRRRALERSPTHLLAKAVEGT